MEKKQTKKKTQNLLKKQRKNMSITKSFWDQTPDIFPVKLLQDASKKKIYQPNVLCFLCLQGSDIYQNI